MQAAEARGIVIPAATDFASTTGKGVSARVEGRPVDLGNVELLKARGIDPGALASRADALRLDGQTVLMVAVDGHVAGLVAVADRDPPVDARSGRRS